MKTPRLYQDECVTAPINYFYKKTGHPIICSPTGSGKSLIIAETIRRILAQWPNQRIVCVTHSKEIIVQNMRAIQEQNPSLNIGVYAASLRRKEARHPVVVSSIQSCYKKAHVIGWVDLLIIDECHAIGDMGMYRQFIATLQEINPMMKCIGYSATPYRLKSGKLTEGEDRIFTDICIEIPIKRLVEEGYLTPLVGKLSLIQADLSEVRITAGEFNSKDAEKAFDVDDLTAAMLDEVIELATDRKAWLFFCSGIRHAERVKDALLARRISAMAVSSKTPDAEREEILAAFERGEFRALTNANLLTTGYDCPRIDMIAMLRATQSPGLFVQVAGRGMRLHPDKKDCLFLDYGGNLSRHGVITDVRPPKRAGRGNSRAIAPTCRICPDCRSAAPLTATECADCGYIFQEPLKIKHDAEASMLDPMERQRTFVDVDSVTYARHKKEGKPDSLRVKYRCGMVDYTEWVCLEHTGSARVKAENWWRRRDSRGVIGMPDTIELALKVTHMLEEPRKIEIRKNGKYMEVIGYVFKTSPAQEPGNQNNGPLREEHANQLPQASAGFR